MKGLKKTRWDPAKTTVESVREALPVLAADLFRAGRKAASGKIEIERLHAFRLRTKRFRYTLEVFRPLYGPAADSRLADLRKLQQHLGRISDCDSTRRLLEGYRGRYASSVNRILRLVEKAERRRVRRFLAHWRDVFDAQGRERHWVAYLRDYAGRSSASPRPRRAPATARSAGRQGPKV